MTLNVVTHLYECRVIGPVLQSLLNRDTQLLEDREAESGLHQIGMLVEVIGTFRVDEKTIVTPRALHRVLKEGRKQQSTACQLLV